MRWLELKVPPPVVALVLGGAMWGVARYTVALDLSAVISRALPMVVALLAGGIDLAALIAFRRARTTIHPMRPERSSALVDSGVYKRSRNPMYLGMALLLVAWALWLASVWAWLGPLAFVLYMNRFQIGPEERVLAQRFGDDFATYRARVRRWI